MFVFMYWNVCVLEMKNQAVKTVKYMYNIPVKFDDMSVKLTHVQCNITVE